MKINKSKLECAMADSGLTITNIRKIANVSSTTFARLKKPEKSDRQIAKGLGVSDKTVSAQRKEMERGAEIPHLKKITGADGKEYPRPPKPQTKVCRE